MLAAVLTFDHARAAEKMADWGCVGGDNPAWQEGPYLSAPEGERPVDHRYAYTFRTSPEFGRAAGLVLGSKPKKTADGGVPLPLPPKDKYQSRVEPVIAKLAIIEQFELFKEFLVTFSGPFNRKRCKQWEGRVDQSLLDQMLHLTDRRNELTHDSDHSLPSMREAVDYFYQLRELAPIFHRAGQSS